MSGYRLLIRVPEAETPLDALRIAVDTFQDERIAMVAVVVRSPKGSSALYCCKGSRSIPPDGYRVLIPKSFRWTEKAA